jgi:hypothetical protein
MGILSKMATLYEISKRKRKRRRRRRRKKRKEMQ